MSDLPPGWSTTELASICTSITDGDHQPPPQAEDGIPFLVIGNVRDGEADFTGCRHVPKGYFDALTETRKPRKGDVLFTLVGSYGIPVLVRDNVPFCVQRHIGILRPSNEISSRFLALALSDRAVYEQATNFATGTAQMTVPLSGLRRISILIPPRREQDRIVAAIEEQFSRIDAGMVALKHAALGLKRLRSSAIEHAVIGMSSRRDQVGEITDSQTPGGSHLPELAPGWTWRRLGDLLASGPQNGLYVPREYYGRGEPILRINDFQSGWIRKRSELNHVQVNSDTKAAYGLRAGDFVINRVNSMTHLGKCAVVDEGLSGVLFESNMMRFNLQEFLLPKYLVLYLQTTFGHRSLVANAKQAVNQASINQKDVKSVFVPVPPAAEQEEIVAQCAELLDALSASASDIEAARRRCGTLRSAVLAAAFSGRLVSHDQLDQPASAFLAKIASKRP